MFKSDMNDIRQCFTYASVLMLKSYMADTGQYFTYASVLMLKSDMDDTGQCVPMSLFSCCHGIA